MAQRLIICGTFNLAFTIFPLLASFGALLCARKNNTGSTAPATFLTSVKRFIACFHNFAGDASLTALSLTVLVAVICQWNLKTIISLTQGAIVWAAALGVIQTHYIAWGTFLGTPTRRWIGGLSILGLFSGLFIAHFYVDYTSRLFLFSASTTVLHLARGGWAALSLLELTAANRKPTLWNVVNDKIPYGNWLSFDLFRALANTAVAFTMAAYARQEQNKLFGYLVQISVFNGLLSIEAMPKLIRQWWPRQSEDAARSSDMTRASSSQEHIIAEVQSLPQYPGSICKSESEVLAEPRDATC